jgi:hypothetical protein
MCAFTSSSKSSIKFSRMLDEHQILLSLQLMDLEVQEAKLADKQVHNVHSFDRRDLSVELEELRASMDGVEDEHITKVGKLSTLVVGDLQCPSRPRDATHSRAAARGACLRRRSLGLS